MNDSKVKIFNSISKKKERFLPQNPDFVKMYTCGPTVYNNATIGNWRTYVLGDIVHRSLLFLGYEVDYVMNITDVGHLTGDNEGDADTGDDRLEVAGREEKKSAWDIAKFYTETFLMDFQKLNLLKPRIFSKATDHIEEQIQLVKRIEERGYAYETGDGIYFDVGSYEKDGNVYGELSNLDQIKEGARVKPNAAKKDPRDFALWKFSPTDIKRAMEWNSPWGVGFPGWHVECSAMSMKYLGDQIDIHLGGQDLMSTHHPNEIAQSEAATGVKPFVKYWMHGAFLLVDEGRMGKSIGNAYTLADLEEKSYLPSHLRYFYLTGHYRKKLNFTWQALESSKKAYEKLLRHLKDWSMSSNLQHSKISEEYLKKMKGKILDDFNMPEVLALVWDLVKSTLSKSTKAATLLEIDKVLGLGLKESMDFEEIHVSKEIEKLLVKREDARRDENWELADQIRKQLLIEHSLLVKDTTDGYTLEREN